MESKRERALVLEPRAFRAPEVRTCNHFCFSDCIIVIIFYVMFIRILTHTIDQKGVMIGAITSGQIVDFIGKKGVRWRIFCRDCSYLSIFPAQTFSHNLLSLLVESGHGDVIHDLYSRMVHSLRIFYRISPIFNYNFDIFVYVFLHVLPSGFFNVGIFFPLFWEISSSYMELVFFLMWYAFMRSLSSWI